MRLCSYVVVHDTGFAPNPFGEVATLAACTPNHQGVTLGPGDWILGHTTKATGNRLVHAMRISERLHFDDYFHDPRFEGKKPRRGGTWEERCGDNIYYQELGRWRQAFTYHHREQGRLEKDTRHPYVLISDHFFYFGENAPEIPTEFAELIQPRQGVRCSKSPRVAHAFVTWLEATYHRGRHGDPRDRAVRPGASHGHVVPRVRKSRRTC